MRWRKLILAVVFGVLACVMAAVGRFTLELAGFLGSVYTSFIWGNRSEHLAPGGVLWPKLPAAVEAEDWRAGEARVRVRR